jgi:glycosyltransferase involved in cell wall biosynthesis
VADDSGTLPSVRPTIAIGPELRDFGSWQWLGADLIANLTPDDDVRAFAAEDWPLADVAVFIKFLPAQQRLQDIRERSAIVYCPVDFYGQAAEIDADVERLRLCDRIVVHSPRLRPYFQSYAVTSVLDHHLKYVIPTRNEPQPEGPILWVGVRSNLPPLVEYVNRHPLPAELIVLTNPQHDDELNDPTRFGFSPKLAVRIERWSPDSHLHWLSRCRGAIDIKGQDFRARHKSAAKALDFLASGVPLAMNPDSSSVAHIRTLGFEVADPRDAARWLSAEYAQQTADFGRRLSAELAAPVIMRRWRSLLSEAFRHRQRPSHRTTTAQPQPPISARDMAARPRRLAIVSLLFNWPSTGGGTVHTAETARFLARAGYDVRHFVVRFAGWSVGQVLQAVDWSMEFIDFNEDAWRSATIQQRVREAVDRFAPDAAILTDSWNFKPRLAEALGDIPYYLRLAAQECLCPLNNVRLLGDGHGTWRSCPQHQLAIPDVCQACIRDRGSSSGPLHRAERDLSGFGSPDYDRCLRRAFRQAAGVLVVNPLIAECVKPFANAVHVIPSGFDAARFPPPPPAPARSPLRLLFAGLVDDPMKGFAVLHAACEKLWAQRRDFWLVATSEPIGMQDAFTEFVGWQSQADLPQLMHACDVVVCPTVAEEALGRTAVEGMGAGRPVVASRIGGLPFTVLEEATGLLCKPGDAADLARQLHRLLDDALLRERLGQAGRRRFESHYTWEAILPQYVQVLGHPVRSPQ